MKKRPEISLGRRFWNLRTAITIALALSFILFLLFRLEVDLGATGRMIRGSNPLLYFLSFLVYYASFPLRAWRWNLLLKNAGMEGVPSPGRLTPLLLLNWFANCILPVRLGDAYRAYLLREEAGASLPRTVGTVAAERAMDLVVVVGLMFLAGVGIGQGRWGSLPYLAVGLVVLLGLFLLGMAKLAPRLSRRLPLRLAGIFASFQQGVLGSFRRLPLIAALSTLIWLLEAGRLILVAWALGLHPNPLLLLFTSQAIALLVSVPVTPGGLGLVEPGVAGILMTSLSREEAWSISLLDRTVAYLSLILVGLIILLLREVGRARRLRPSA